MSSTSYIQPAKNSDIPRSLPVVFVTPQMAQEWLDNRFDNERSIRPNKVNAFARDMEKDNWKFIGDVIRFSLEGKLMDGQHRLSAIVQSKKSQWFLIVNLPEEARPGIDTGSARTLGDILRIGNHIQGRELAAIVRRVLIYRNGVQGSTGGRYLPTHSEGVDFVAANEEPLLRALKVAVKAHNHSLPLSPSSLAAAYFLCAQKDQDTADDVFERIVTGIGIGVDDPVAAYRNRVISFYSRNRQRLNPDDVFRFAIVTFNLARKGVKTRRLQAPKAGWNATNVPVPE